jgi:hypothetical protein
MDAILRVTPWDDGLRSWRLIDNRWVEEWHDWQLAFVGEARRRSDHPARDVARTVPDDAADLAAAAGGYEITALRLLRTDPQAWELARSAPNLFWLLCAHLGDRNEPTPAADSLFGAARTALLGMCVGGPVRPAALRFVERFRPRERSGFELRLLRRGVRPPVMHLMRRCSHFGPWMLQRAVWGADLAPHSPDDLTSDAFFADALRLCSVAMEAGRALERDDEPLQDAQTMCDDALDVARALGLDEEDAEEQVRSVPSVKRLRGVHDRWVARLNAEFPERARQRRIDADPLLLADDAPDEERLPTSGLADTQDIRAIRTVGGLRAEGHEMEHCAGAYVERCLRGESFVFRVVRPGRATLEVHLRDGRPVVGQLKGPHNSEPSADTTTAVERWLGG